METTLIHPPKTIREVWESLPEGTLCQLINEKLVMSPAPIILHQEVLNEINISISVLLRKHNLGKVFIAPLDVHFSKENILQPDIFFIKTENIRKIKSRGLFGAPDFIVEILSTATSHLDFGEKKLIYEKYGVREYFIVEPNSKSVTSFLLKNKKYEEQKKTKGIIKSILLHTEIRF